MNSKIKALSVAAALAASLGLAGCATDAGSSGGSTMPMNHGTSGPASSMMPDASAGHNPADIAFSQMMIPHHAQAVEMSDMILAKPDMPADVTALATKIKDAQAPEIEIMTGWLEDWDMPAMMSDHSGHGMTGMVDSEGMEKLKDAQGTDAVRLFLEHMIGHHEGAIDMAQQEIAAGKHPESIQLARDIATSQEAEIAEMKEMLAGL
ncbi:DUF305 domain-containing protein [Pseudarthrobacter scleromae]|uniref:DUF305 domain-containing protein n=1 Tax=Pseudarthrobacter scleromae TaxID=158897 RepID=UPI00362B49F1